MSSCNGCYRRGNTFPGNFYHIFLLKQSSLVRLKLRNIAYSRGHKNRAIVKKLFEISPIFYEGIEGQLFMLMRFFYSSKDLTCMLGSFCSQTVHVGRPRRPWRPPFFFLLQFFTWCLVNILLDVLKKLQCLKKWGLWPSKRKEYLRQQLWAAWAVTAPPSTASWLKQRVSQQHHSLE
jgi:hypothetical protein